MTSPVLTLADALARRLLEADPVMGSALGLREWDGKLSDPSSAAQSRLAQDLTDIENRAAELDPGTPAERITRLVISAACRRYRSGLEVAEDQFTVSALPISGPPALFAQAARTVLPDADAAMDYLARLRAAPAWVDAICDRLREGRERGRLPVASLVRQAIDWVDRTSANRLPPALLAPEPPSHWDAAASWRADIETVIVEGITPALQRWRALLEQLLPAARSDADAGLAALPGGAQLYRRCIAVHTTLELSADELHDIGHTAITELEARALALGGSLGLTDLPAIVGALRESATAVGADQALADARVAVARAETVAPKIMPPPLPDPCAVEPMPVTVAEAGMPPHYTRPRADTGRPGTFWFNTLRPTAGTGWDIEAVAFHETVPGHHSQLARLQQLGDLPLLHQFSVTVHSEGWGLYAERLAGEFGLYSDARAELGAVYCEMFRAARLVVDTGLHDRGWSREQAVRFMAAHVALPESFLADEVDRYLAWPGQALAYLTGQREILRLRHAAEAELGDRFDLPGFHAALLDSGSLPMPVLGEVIAGWVAEQGDQAATSAS